MKFKLNILPFISEEELLYLRIVIENISQLKLDLLDEAKREDIHFSIPTEVDSLGEVIRGILGISFSEVMFSSAGKALLSPETLEELIKNGIDAFNNASEQNNELVIELHIKKLSDNRVVIEFSDNGEGFPVYMLGEYANRRYKKDLQPRRCSFKAHSDERLACQPQVTYLGGANLGLEWVAMVCQASLSGSLMLENIILNDVIKGAKITATSDLMPGALNFTDFGRYESLFGCRFCVYEAILARKLEDILGEERVTRDHVHEAYNIFTKNESDLTKTLGELEEIHRCADCTDSCNPVELIPSACRVSPVTMYRETVQASNSVQQAVFSPAVPSPSAVDSANSRDSVIPKQLRRRSIPPSLNLSIS